ncbi:hypothetical protein BKA70DRAFT_1379131 [Coprinopsis sp. MPI-PUGE-AT-0042]|nr:hypothetical protein BKA70DRAFT_1379131 [Coprinopsis sp. MPI-PUGE-AT-0042]
MPEKTLRFGDYLTGVEDAYNNLDVDEPREKEPWRPFRTLLDFEIAELMQDTNMTRGQKGALIRLIRQCIDDPDQYTLFSKPDLSKTWDDARRVHMSSEDIEYTTFARPIMNWMTDILNDKKLQSACQFDAVQISQYDAGCGEFDRHYSDPWTGRSWWEIQAKLPNNAGIFCIIIHADKTKLSSFGTAKGYLVYARCGNLPLHIRNGHGNGALRLVGWLPIVADEHSEDFTEKGYVNFKRIVWTEGFRQVLESARMFAATGLHFDFIDGTSRWLHPIVMILSADYEEYKFPCPVCLVPGNDLSDLSKTHPLCTTDAMKEVLASTANMNATQKEEILKNVGLQDIPNLFWDFSYWDLYRALAWDRLHAFHIGLFRDHLLKEFLRILRDVLKGQIDQVNSHLAASPKWSGLNTFTSLSNLAELSDARKFEDLSKTQRNSHRATEPYRLLLLIRAYMELDMFASLRNPSEKLVQAHESAIQSFDKCLKEFVKTTTNTNKSWDAAPKVHTHIHAPNNVRDLGASINGSTKTFEDAHGPIREDYQTKTNFKNVGAQLTRLSDEQVACYIMRNHIDLLHAYQRMCEGEEADEEKDITPVLGTDCVSLGSKQPVTTIQGVIAAAPSNFARAFVGLAGKISRRLNAMKLTEDNSLVRLNPDHEITVYRLIRVQYASLDDWSLNRDLIRASPRFYNQERYDCLAWQVTDTKITFGQLLSAFAVEYGVGTRTKDKDFKFVWVCRRPWADSLVIPIDSIVRGACLPRAWDSTSTHEDEHILNDCIDTDWWLRSKNLLGSNPGLELRD